MILKRYWFLLSTSRTPLKMNNMHVLKFEFVCFNLKGRGKIVAKIFQSFNMNFFSKKIRHLIHQSMNLFHNSIKGISCCYLEQDLIFYSNQTLKKF